MYKVVEEEKEGVEEEKVVEEVVEESKLPFPPNDTILRV